MATADESSDIDVLEDEIEKVSSPETLSVWGLAWPSIIANILFAAVGIVGLKAVGALGTEALAAVGTGQRIFFVIQSLIMAVSTGTTALIARAYGSGNKEEGAGEQGIMFGYACNETDVLMPAPIHYSHKILSFMAEDRKAGKLKNIEPDSKSQVTFEYHNGKPFKVKSVVISSQHSADIDQAQVRDLLRPYLLKSIPKNFLEDFDEKEFYVNPTGNFVIGGPDGDCGLTGRKIIVDTYGGAAPHGGGAFSGKDPTKVDRSAAYAARYIAKNIVASKIADKCLIQLAYAIGVSKPLSIYVDLFEKDLDKNKFVIEQIKENFDLSPKGIREMLNLNKPIYEKTAAYGHFGRTPDDDGSFSWEKTDKIKIFSK